MNLVHIGFLVLLAITGYCNCAEICDTPGGEAGRCIESGECPGYLEALQMRPLLAETISFLRLAQCGYAANVSKVCCPTSGQYRNLSLPYSEEPIKRRERPTRVDNLEIGDRFGDAAILPSKDICGKQIAGNRIFDGQITGIDEFPWMALLDYKNKNYKGLGYYCGGVLISHRYVLTAAHCVSGESYSKFGGLVGVRLGEYNTESEADCIRELDYWDCADPPQDFGIEEIIPHPEYRADTPDQHNDIAILRLDRNVKFSDFIQPLCLPLAEYFPKLNVNPGKPFVVAGWGRTELGIPSPVKLKLKVPLVKNEDCVTPYMRLNVRVWQRQLCAGGELHKDSCNGDSGGPLMGYDRHADSWFLLGLVSLGPVNCGKAGIPGIYTRVPQYLDWIKGNMRT